MDIVLLVKGECANVELKLSEGKEKINMCKAIEDMKNDARNEGRADAQLTSIRNVMTNLGVSLQRAMEILGIPAESRKNTYQ
ncbi:hypothetical protein D081_1757 [Anaerovibrio sp. JC8]|uniref:hypothetical protein n=1 Tax=Anaerovibrio sp. JC8 TaxID=1240085 RepID=UPI000A0CEA34|nr:hypothetical protein [Anaerovibrio sp. JC8]ORT99607.1 hypothetical protein D081_1757 [Anaerovibrio sp. JC8]